MLLDKLQLGLDGDIPQSEHMTNCVLDMHDSDGDTYDSTNPIRTLISNTRMLHIDWIIISNILFIFSCNITFSYMWWLIYYF